MEGITTRSSRKRLIEHSESLHDIRPSKSMRVLEPDILTPPPSQPNTSITTRRWRGKRQYEDPLDQPPPTPTYPGRRKTSGKHEGDGSYGSSSSMDASCSTSTPSLDAPMTNYHNDDITSEFGVEFGDYWQGVGVDGLASGKDPFLHTGDNGSTKGERDLHTPTPSLSPRDEYERREDMSPTHNDMATSTMPKTPMPRPGTPDYNPLASAIDTSMTIPSLDHDDEDENDTSSLVAGSTLANYGPPPTPMCPPRVGNLSSSSSTSSLLQLSSALRNTTSTSAAPPLNILESDEDDDDDDENNLNQEVSIVQNNQITNESSPLDNKSNMPSQYNNQLNEDETLDLSTPKTFQSNRSSSSSPPPLSPSTGSRISKHSHRLRIRALPLSRSGHKRSDRKDGKSNRGRDSSHSIKSILKTGGSISKRRISGNSRTSAESATRVAINDSKKEGRNEQSTKKGDEVLLMPPPKPKPAALVPSSPSVVKGVSSLSKQNGTLSVRTAAYPPEISKNNSRARDGNIICLKLTNFMGHQNKKFEFKEGGLTFVTGPNGCGKTSMQTSLQVLFGVKASNTLRAKSMKGLIKTGSPFAEIEGHFTNYSGTLSKKRFGEVLQLKRRIKLSGTSTYSVMEKGKWRQIKQYELTVFSHSLNIDPNNPCQFLKQDRSQESSKPGSTQQSSRDFIKFNQATQLADIKDMVTASEENKKVFEDVIKDKKEEMKFFALQEKQYKETLDQILKMESTGNRIPELEIELEWSKVKVMKEEEKSLQADKAKVYAQSNELKEEKKKLEDDISNFSSMEEKNKKLHQDAKRQMTQLESERETKTQELRKVKQTQQRALSQHGTISKSIRQYTEEIEKLKMEENKETISYEAENQKHLAEIATNQQKIEEEEENLNGVRNERDRILAEINEYKAKLRKEMSGISQLESQLNETNRELSKKNNYGRHMKELLVRIEEHRGWTKKPIGPLGQHILVQDATFAPLIEYILYYALFTFVVTTKEDLLTLKGMMEKVYNDKDKDKGKANYPSVLLIKEDNMKDYQARLNKVKSTIAQAGYPSVLSMLTIKDPMVLRGLVEKISCERILLFENNQVAASVMKNCKNFPQEVTCGYTLEWYKVNPDPRYGFSPLQGKIKCTTDIIPMAKGETTMKINEEIARKRQVADTCKINQKGLEKLLRQSDSKIQEVNKRINQLKNKIKHSQNCIREEPTQEQDRDIEEQIKMVEEMRASREKEIQVALKELELAKEKTSSLKAEIERIDSQVPEMKRKLDELEGDQNGTNRTVAKLAKEIDEYKSKILRLDREFQILGDAETKIYFDLGDLEKKASQLGPCPKNLNREPEAIERELENTRQFLEKNRDKLSSKKRVLTEYNNCKALVEHITMSINSMEKIWNHLEPYIKVNTDLYEKLKHEMSNQITSNFRTLVEAHGLTGDLIIDWEQETLVYYVCPDKNAEKKAKESYSKKDGEMVVTDKQGVFNYVQNLSGGERSKALVFFIMAVWKITDMPFHMLDEFETCLDHLSRKDIHDKIIHHAKKHPESQFFIITPQEIPPISPELMEFVTILRLKKTK